MEGKRRKTPSGKGTPRERVQQKLRTQRDLQAAAAAIVMERGELSLATAAARAGVSRATAYRFYPRPEMLMLEALLGAGKARLEAFFAETRLPDDPERRLKMVLDCVADVTEQHEESWRAYLRYALSLGDERSESVRPGQRLVWIDRALEPVRKLRPPKRYQELRNALALTLGIEPFIVLRDVCRLEYPEVRKTLWMTARTLLRSYVNGE